MLRLIPFRNLTKCVLGFSSDRTKAHSWGVHRRVANNLELCNMIGEVFANVNARLIKEHVVDIRRTVPWSSARHDSVRSIAILAMN